MSIDLLQGAEVLFSEGLPTNDDGSLYSFAWTGSISEESTTDFLRKFQRVKNVKEVFADIDSQEMFASVPQNLIMAFADGDIAYFLANTMPIRKSNKPYTGCRILDGSKSDDDWVGYVKPKDLPRVINPKKGFIVTANNRQMPDNVNIDVGATITSTIRAQRITELIQKGIDANHKFDYNDMLTIQNDTVDLMARDITPLVTKLAIEMLDVLSPIHAEHTQEIVGKLIHWYGDMSESSVGATVFATW
jgi:penicillin amidase